MRHIVCYMAFTMVSIQALSQDNLQVQFAYRGTVAAARFLPSTQILDGYKYEFGIQYSSWIANSSITYGSLRKIYKHKQLTPEDVDGIIEDLDTNNKIGGGQDFTVLTLGLNKNIKEHPVAWSFSIYDRMNLNLFIPKTLVQVAWQGNKQFEGQFMDHSNTRLVGLYFREFSLGAATTIISWPNWILRGGFRFSYYQGLSGFQTTKSKIFSQTALGAEYIDLDYDIEYRYTGIDDFNLFDTRGNGFGANLGVTFSYKEKLNFDLGITDLGSLKLKQDVAKVNSESDFRFYGLGLEELIDPTAFLDSLEEIFTPEIDTLGTNSFEMPIGTKLSIMVGWSFGKITEKHGLNTLYLAYIQGFDESPGVTQSPKFTLGIHKLVFRHLNLGLSASLGGFNDYAVGGLLGLQFKNVRFSLQSDDLTGFIAPNKTTGAGAGFILQLLF